MRGFDAPYLIAQVELDEQPGLRLTTNLIDCDPSGARIGMPVSVAFEDRSGGLAVPQFRPLGAGRWIRRCATARPSSASVTRPMVRKSEKSLAAVAVEAAVDAIADAGLTPQDIDGYAGTPKAPNASALHWDGVDEISERYMASALGLTNMRWASDANRGVVADGIVAGIQALVTGTARYVLCLRAMYDRPGVRYASSDREAAGGPEQFSAPYGVGIGGISLWLQRYMYDYGATREELFDVVGALREHAQLNPHAYWRGRPLTLGEYLESRWIYEPMCLYDYDIPVTGAGAVVLTTADRAAALPHKPAYVAGFANTRDRGRRYLRGVGRRAGGGAGCAALRRLQPGGLDMAGEARLLW